VRSVVEVVEVVELLSDWAPAGNGLTMSNDAIITSTPNRRRIMCLDAARRD
jgi:hypothetical protein